VPALKLKMTVVNFGVRTLLHSLQYVNPHGKVSRQVAPEVERMLRSGWARSVSSAARADSWKEDSRMAGPALRWRTRVLRTAEHPGFYALTDDQRLSSPHLA
jgi:hypothetical protein